MLVSSFDTVQQVAFCVCDWPKESASAKRAGVNNKPPAISIVFTFSSWCEKAIFLFFVLPQQ